MHRLLPALFLMASLPSGAQTSFSEEQVLFRDNQPGSTRLADLDGDLDDDVVISGSSGIFVLENTDGAGTLAPPVFVGAGTLEQFGDLDGDGLVDLVTTYKLSPTSTTSNIAWQRNLGGATSFSAAIDIKTSERFTTLLPPTNLDGDSDLDIIWLDGNNDLLEWSENTDGTGNAFAAPVSLLTSLNILDPFLADLNGDTIPDFVGKDWKGTPLGSDDEVVFFPGQNTTPLSFGAAVSIATNTPGLLAVVNMDGDTDLDVVLGVNGSIGFEWRANDGSGTFGPGQPLAATLTGTHEFVSQADMDGDSDLDIVFSLRQDDAFWLEHTDGAGSYAGPVSVASPDGVSFDHLAVGDLNGDDDPDVVTTEDFLVALHANNSDATSFGPPVAIFEAIDDITDLQAIDLDADGSPEILFSTQDGKLFCTPNLGNGSFAPASKVLSSLNDLELIEVVDLDGLGTVDLIGVRRDDNIVAWHAGTGLHAFGPAQALDTTGATPDGIATADFDGNGSLDIAIAYSDDNAVAWFSQDPVTHVFTKTTLTGAVPQTRAIAAGNLDGVAGVEIVAGDFTNDKILVFYNTDGMGGFSAATEVGTMTGSPSQIELADIDGDFDLDIVVLENDGANSEIAWFANNGAGGFGPASIVYTTGLGLTSMALGDLDEDNDIDFATANFNTDQVRWHANNGMGGFDPSGVLLTGFSLSSPYEVRLADLDDDGDLDILNASRFQGIVGWFENRFGETPLTAWAEGFGLSGADLDPDSDSDHDGMTLLEEFAYNLDPTVFDRQIVPETAGTMGLPNQWFTFSPTGVVRAQGTFIRRRDRVAIGLTYIVERSPDLEEWFTLTPNTSTNINDDYQFVTYNRQVNSKPPLQFQRIRLVFNPPPP